LFDTYAVSQAIAGVNAANVVVGGALTAANVYNKFLAATTILKESNIDPLMTTVAAFVEPKFEALVKQSAMFDATDNGLDMRKRGYIGMVDGVRLYTTNSMTGKNSVLFMQDKAGHFVDQLNEFDIEKIVGATAHSMTGEVVYDAKIMPSNDKRLASLTYTIA
jgi:hypothetical protein